MAASFTGAVSDKVGLFEAANGGTIFLDEVNSLPLSAQVKLLRVLQEQRFTPVGSVREISVNVRVIAASNANLEGIVREGSFREDLYYRLNVVQIPMPALRERTEDIPERHRMHMLRPRPIEVREIDPQDQLNPEPKSDVNHMWFRAPDAAGQEPWMHHCLMAYASDMSILGSAARRHGVSWLSGQMMGASLDHALWFHAPLNFDEWHLYTMDSPFAGNARSFNRGSVFTRDGALVASVAQEGLMRPVRKKG